MAVSGKEGVCAALGSAGPPTLSQAGWAFQDQQQILEQTVPGARRGWVRQRLKQLRSGVITYVAVSTPASCPLNPPPISYLLRFTSQL